MECIASNWGYWLYSYNPVVLSSCSWQSLHTNLITVSKLENENLAELIHAYNYIVSCTWIVTQKSWSTGTQLWGIWTLTSGKSGTIQVNSGLIVVPLVKMKDLGRQIAANEETLDSAQTACANGKSHLGTVEVSIWK